MVLISTTLGMLVLSLPVLEDVVDVLGGLLVLLFISLLIQVLVNLIHKVQVEGPHVFIWLEGLLHVAELFIAVPSVALTAPTMTTTIDVTEALSSVHEGLVPVA